MALAAILIAVVVVMALSGGCGGRRGESMSAPEAVGAPEVPVVAVDTVTVAADSVAGRKGETMSQPKSKRRSKKSNATPRPDRDSPHDRPVPGT